MENTNYKPLLQSHQEERLTSTDLSENTHSEHKTAEVLLKLCPSCRDSSSKGVWWGPGIFMFTMHPRFWQKAIL